MSSVYKIIIIRLHTRDLIELNPIFRVDIKLLVIYASIVLNYYRVYKTEEIRNDMFYTITAHVFVFKRLSLSVCIFILSFL